MKIRGLFKKAAATLMAAVTALSILPATTAFAAGDIGTISFSHTYDSSGNAMRYNSSATFDGHTAGGTGNYKYRMFVDGENAFCIQPGVPLNTGNTLKKASSDTWNALSANQKKAVGLALLYGYQGNRSNLKTSDIYSRSNAWRFSQELLELYPLRYLYHEDDVVYIGADKYEVVAFDENAVSLRNPEFPLFGKELSRADFEEKLKENPANDHLKVVVTEKQKTEIPPEQKPDGIQFSIGFSEHPAFYDRQFNDRYTDLSFALGNYLLGVLDEKQHREREGDDNVGWYHKTDFDITVTIGGEDFHYDGRFDIGDGEGDLIAHIKNFYEYSLSPDCPFIPEWKKQGEDYYREKMESLRWGRDVFIPYLEQHKDLTPEDRKLFDEIMSFEKEWFVPAEETRSVTDREIDILRDVLSQMKMDDIGLSDENGVIVARDEENRWQGTEFYHFLIDEAMNFDENGELVGMVMDADTLSDFKELAKEKGIPVASNRAVPHYTVEQTSDAFADPFIIRDNSIPEGQDGQYYDVGGIYQTFETEEEAQEYADTLNSAENNVNLFAQKDAERSRQEQDTSDLIGKEIVIDNRRYLIESVGKVSDDVSMRDITFKDSVLWKIGVVIW